MLNPVDERRERRRRENPTINTRDFDMMESIYTLCGIIAVTGILMGAIVGVLWLLGVSL
jgi:hypothetical protein